MRHFKIAEFNCPCCGKNNMNESFLARLDRARGISEVAYKINSGCRCEAHNKAVGGSETSSHLKGCACDISATDSRTRAKIIFGLILAGFNRMGIAKDFIHVDNDPKKTKNVLWLYD